MTFGIGLFRIHQIHLNRLGQPDHRCSGGVLDRYFLPALCIESRTVGRDIVSPFSGVFRTGGTIGRPLGPTPEVLGDLRHRPLAKAVHLRPELRNLAIVLIGRDEGETDPLTDGPADLIESDGPFRPVAQVIRNARFTAAIPIVGPLFGQKQVTGHHTGKGVHRIILHVKQMLTHDTVVYLAGFSAPLPLDSGRLRPLFCMA